MADTALLKAGEHVDHLKVVKRLGVGGMGQVYMAIDAETGQDVALKVVSKDDPIFDMLERLFRHEVSIYQRIHHPNVVAYVSHGETERFLYLVLEHILGVSMRTKLTREGPAGLIATFSWMQETVLALHAAHQQCILHRDLKPDNIMVTRTHNIKLIDFGIATTDEGDGPACLIRPGDALPGKAVGETDPWMGTLAYSAPEHILGKEVDEQADIYALGILFYEMITGKPLLDKNATSVSVLQLQRMLDDRRHVLWEYGENALAKAIDNLLHDMMRFDPEERIESTGEVMTRLEEIAEAVGGPVQLLSRDEAKRVAQQESADRHFWNALDLIEKKSLEPAVEELSNVVLFKRALDPLARRMLTRQLDLMLLNVKVGVATDDDPLAVSSSEFFSLQNDLLDICGKLMAGDQEYLRAYLVLQRVCREFEVPRIGPFLQSQAARRPHLSLFSSAFVRLTSGGDKPVARKVWMRLIRDLLQQDRLLEAEYELREFERRFSLDALDTVTHKRYRSVEERHEAEQRDFEEAIAHFESTGDYPRLVLLCEEFLERYPQSLSVHRKLRHFLLAAGRDDEARAVHKREGSLLFRSGELVEAEELFVDVLQATPEDEEAALYLYAALVVRKEDPGQPPSDFNELKRHVYRYFVIDVPGNDDEAPPG